LVYSFKKHENASQPSINVAYTAIGFVLIFQKEVRVFVITIPVILIYALRNAISCP